MRSVGVRVRKSFPTKKKFTGRVGVPGRALDGHGWSVRDVHAGKNDLSGRRPRGAALSRDRAMASHQRGEGVAVQL